MTIDQLKKSLTEQGITLPPSRSKKADYIKLYKQYSTINDSLGDVYSSDDENPPKTDSQSVSSSTSPGKSDNIAKEVELLSDDELYYQLKELDKNVGPVLKNTRRVYEKKLIKLLSSSKGTNGYNSKTNAESLGPTMEEFSDSDAEVISFSPKKNEIKTRKTSVLRDSPKPSLPEPSKPDIEKSFSSSYDCSNRSSTPNYTAETTSRYSYIETVPKGSTYSFIDHAPNFGFDSDLRQRIADRYNSDKFSIGSFSSEKYNTNKTIGDDLYKRNIENRDQFKPGIGSHFKSVLGNDDQLKSGYHISAQNKPTLGISNKYKSGGAAGGYVGTWEPNINRYLNTGTQKKNSHKANNYSGLLKNFIAGTV